MTNYLVQVKLESGNSRLVTYLPISHRKRVLEPGMKISLKDDGDTIWTIKEMYNITSREEINRTWKVGGISSRLV